LPADLAGAFEEEAPDFPDEPPEVFPPDFVDELADELADLADDFAAGFAFAVPPLVELLEEDEALPDVFRAEADELLPDLLEADFVPPVLEPDLDPGDLPPVTASAAEMVAPATAPDAAPDRTSPTTSFALSYIVAIVPLDRELFFVAAIWFPLVTLQRVKNAARVVCVLAYIRRML
jgi:hypothetical protein